MASGTRIGWVGTGVMGASMCQHLLDAGHEVTVNTRSKEKAQGLLDRGAHWAETPAAAANGAAVCFAIVGLPADVREVFLGPDGLVAGAEPGAVLVDMTTSEPSLAVEIAEAAAGVGVGSLDAPVSGGDVGAKNGTLSIMVGGPDDAVAKVMPLFELFGSTITHLGPAGSGQHTKMVNQILIAGTMMGLAEAVTYAKKAGLDPTTVLDAVGGGAAGSWSLANLAPRVVAGDFGPGFYVDHFVKDMTIAVTEADSLGVHAPALKLALEQYLELQSGGGGTLGTQAIARQIGEQSGVDW